MSDITLGGQQREAANAFGEWLKEFNEGTAHRPFFVLAGLAGTGKSYTANQIIREHNLHPQFMAYTGKAALVISKYSGVPASTIHSSIYKLVPLSKDEFDDAKAAVASLTPGTAEHREAEIKLEALYKPNFRLNSDALEGVDLIALDECSMVDEVMLTDLKSFGIPILALGDPGQLPPINGTGALFNGLPDYMLTEIRRQALDNPIIQWALWARENRALPTTNFDTIATDLVAKVQRPMLSTLKLAELFDQHEIILCWRNATRMQINSMMRSLYGHKVKDPVFPVVGERIIFTKNDMNLGVFNGQFAEVLEVGEMTDLSREFLVLPEGAETPVKANILNACWNLYHNKDAMKDLTPWMLAKYNQADFAYALTVHKSQGSQFESVCLVEENAFTWYSAAEDRKRWLYTAITRAVNKFTIIAGKF